MRRPRLSHVLCVFLVFFVRTSAASGQEGELETRPLTSLRAEVATLILGGGAGGAPPRGSPPGGSPPGGSPPGGSPPGGRPPRGDLGAGPLDATPSGPAEPGGEAYGIDFRVEISGPSLLEGAPEERARDLRLELHAYVLTRSGELETTLSRRIHVPPEKLDGLLPSGGIRFTGHLAVPAGEYQLRVLIRDTRTQRFALRLVGLEVPGAAAEPVALSPSGDPGGETLSPSGDPGGETLSPSGDPGGETLSPSGDPGGETLSPSGDQGGETLSPGLKALVVADLDLSPESSTSEQAFLDGRSGKYVRAIAAGYRDVLGRLAEGKMADAVAGLRQLQEEALELDPVRFRGSEWLTAGLDRVVGEIAERNADSLLPILFLHTELYALYIKEQVSDPFLVNPTLRRILDVAQRYALGVEDDLAASLASSVLADTGVALDQAGRPAGARRMFEAALEIDESNPIALLNLAYWYERAGEYRRAVRLLRRLLEVDPRSPEGSLRLALSLERLGQNPDEQEEILRRLIRESPDEWILAIAYQELGALLTAGKRLEEARQLLANGISRLPSEQRLYVQLAYVLDRSGRKREALEVVDRIPADSGKVSPRYLYGRRPRAGEPVRVTLLRHVTARLPVLAVELEPLERRK